MKKILSLFIALLFSYTAFAQVAFLLRKDNINDLPAESNQQPERNAANWFNNTYKKEGDAIVSMEQVKTISANDYKVLWVNVDEEGLTYENFKNAEGAGFTQEVIDGITEFVKNGGNLLLTKQATCLAYEIGRFGHKDNGNKLDQEWNCSADYGTAAIRNINPKLGSGLDNGRMRDCRQHPIYEGLTQTDDKFILVSDVSRTNHLLRWREFERKDGVTARLSNDNVEQLNLYQSDWACDVLAITGDITDFCLPEILELHPQGDYNGSIITITAAAYQWGTNNTGDPLENVKKLTSNALNYLAAGGDEYGYYMPYTLSEIYSIDQYKPEYNAAKWFYDHYIDPNRTTENNYGNGRFIHKEEAIPNGMKVLWVHGDRQGQGKENFYNAMGGNTFKNKLKLFVEGGGNVFLSKQATHFASHIGRTDWEPSYDNRAYNGDPITWYMVSNFVAVGTGVDRHNHRAFHYMEDYTEHKPNESVNEGYCKWPLVSATGGSGNEHSDHKYFWGEPSEIWNNTYHISHSSTQIERLNEFESAQTCRILGGWGHTTALDGAGMVEFLPTSTYKGTIIAQGLPAYQWTSSNTSSNVQNLTKGVLEYLHNADVYTREVTSGLYGTICLPRKMETISEGMTLFRVLSDVTDGIMLQEIDASATVAGEPYFFYSTASEIRVTMTGAAVLNPVEGNGLIGNFGPAAITVTKDNGNYILREAGLYYVNSDNVTIGANRAYLKRSEIIDVAPAPGRIVRKMSIHTSPSTATGLEAPEEDNNIQPIKKLVNGHLYIQYGDKVYDITGNQIQ